MDFEDTHREVDLLFGPCLILGCPTGAFPNADAHEPELATVIPLRRDSAGQQKRLR